MIFRCFVCYSLATSEESRRYLTTVECFLQFAVQRVEFVPHTHLSGKSARAHREPIVGITLIGKSKLLVSFSESFP